MQHQNKTISRREKKGRGDCFLSLKKKSKNKTKQKRATTTTSIPGSQLQKATIFKQGLKTFISVSTLFSF